MCCNCNPNKINRRDFMQVSALSVAGAGLVLSSHAAAQDTWEPDKPLLQTGKKLIVQPVLVYNIYKKRAQTSWRPWGGLHTGQDIAEEEKRINRELANLSKNASFPVEIRPVVKIQSVEQAVKIRDAGNYDVPVVYAASGSTGVLESCFSEKRNNIIFLRHRSGPVYLWYEIIHNRFLRKGGDGYKLDEYRNPAGMDVNDIVVDDTQELLYKLRAIYGIKNFIGRRIVALGGSSGWCNLEAPEIARDKFKLDIITVDYEDLGKRIQKVRANSKRVAEAQKNAERYLAIPQTTLHTDKQFVFNAFLLNDIFKEFMRENDADAFTIKECMSTVIPMAETTACLPLSLLNDEGYIAFCESDFNVIPSGLLLHYISGKPVFLNDPTFPHHGMVTCAHCTAPRRMDGENYALAKVVTHFESDYGATPKVELPLASQVTMICPDGGQKQWLGFTGTIDKNPFYDICRSQYDIKIQGDWKKLQRDHRGFHWMMACGDYTREMEYACPKIGIDWVNVS